MELPSKAALLKLRAEIVMNHDIDPTVRDAAVARLTQQIVAIEAGTLVTAEEFARQSPGA